METLKIELERKGAVDIVRLDGILNADTALSLDNSLKQLSASEKPLLVMDCTLLTYISSAGIGCFIGEIKSIRMKKGDIFFYNASRKVKRVFDLLDMSDFFKFFSDLDEAVEGFC